MRESHVQLFRRFFFIKTEQKLATDATFNTDKDFPKEMLKNRR